MNKALQTILFVITFSQLSFSQKWLKKTRAYSSVGIVAGSDSLAPFLVRSNQYGTLLNTSNFIFVNAGLYKQYDSLYTFNKKLKRFDYGYGFEGHVNLGKIQDFRLPEAFFKVRYGVFELYGGRRKQIQGLVDTTGTMGSYIWSGNAIPLPKVEVSIPNYTPIIGHGLISIKGNFAHGWFGDGDSVKNYWLHQKSFYTRIGKQNWKVKFYGGFNHQVQWGGRPATPFYDPLSNQTITSFGSDFSTFIKVATGVSLSSGSKDWTNQQGVSSAEASNRSGNHLGTVDLGVEIELNKAIVFIYRQNIYEDGSLFYLNNINDGLQGVSFKIKDSKTIKLICIEYLNTTSQGGSVFLNIKPELRGLDNYFNNGLYKDSWIYKGNVIGNSLLTSQQESLNNAKQDANTIVNNVIRAINFSIHYKIIDKYNLRTQIINSNNYGTLQNYLPKKQLSISQSLIFNHKNNNIALKLAGDLGQYWHKNIGVYINYKKYITL